MTEQNKINHYLGIAIIVFSLSYVHFLYPFPTSENNPTVQSLMKLYGEQPQDLKVLVDKVEGTNFSQNPDSLKQSIVRDLTSMWVKTLLYIIWGVVTGILIVKNQKFWRHNALFWAAILLSIKLWGWLKYLPDFEKTFGRIKIFFSFMIEKQPLQLFQGDIIPILVYSLTLIILLKQSSGGEPTAQQPI